MVLRVIWEKQTFFNKILKSLRPIVQMDERIGQLVGGVQKLLIRRPRWSQRWMRLFGNREKCRRRTDEDQTERNGKIN